MREELKNYLDAYVLKDIEQLLKHNLNEWKQYLDHENLYIDLTFGFNENFDQFGYQTGDNSFTGGAYGFKNWIVLSISSETSINDIFEDIYHQLNQLI